VKKIEKAVLEPFEQDDPILGKKISLRVSDVYSVLSIGERQYYFDRETGALDGTGVGAC
jgi:hypothetical protein